MPAKSSQSDIGHLRLANQRIVGSTFRDPVQVVRSLLAMQGQDFVSAKWSIGLRTHPRSAVADATVEAAIAARQIVRSWPMRGTLHFTAAEDLHWMLSLTTPRLVAGAAARRAALGLDLDILDRARDVAGARLIGGAVFTREEMRALFDAAGVSTDGQRGYHILWHLSQTGTLCFGPPRGKEQTFVLLDDWIKRPRPLDRDEALGEWARRYFTGHGPATVKDFAGWTKLTAAEVKIGLAAARRDLVEIDVGGVSHFMGAKAEAALRGVAAAVDGSVALLPAFDEYILGYQDRGAVLASEHKQRILPGGNGIFMATIVVGGQVVGTWRRVSKARESLIQPTLFRKITTLEMEGLVAAAERYGRFIGTAVRVAPGADDGKKPQRTPPRKPPRKPPLKPPPARTRPRGLAG